MKERNEARSVVVPILVALIVCVCTVLGFGAKEYIQGGFMNAPVSQAGGSSSIKYRVLEIEPGWDYMYDESSNNNTLASALGCSASEITFKYVSTAEFNGMNEDLVASYDIIVMGLNTGTMNKINGQTVYNDRDLDGYIYLAYGDLVKYDNRMSGQTPADYVCIDDYINGTNGIPVNYHPYDNNNGYIHLDSSATATTTNWKGNWTLYNMNNVKAWTPALQNYFSGQYYILKDINNTSWSNSIDYYNDPTGNARFSGNDITKRKMNELLDFVGTGRPIVLADDLYNCVNNSTKAAYPTSNVYKFLTEVNGNADIIKLSSINPDLRNAIHIASVELVDYTMKYYNGSRWVDAPPITYNGGIITTSCIINNVEQFKYTVDFKGTIGKRYYVKVIVDKNTDGRYNSVATVDDFNEVYYAKILTADEVQEHVELYINLPNNYNGMFGWQILVEELDDYGTPIDRVSVDGHTVVKGQTKTVKVLQILPNDNGNLNMYDDATFLTEMGNAEGRIGYDISVDTIYVNDFENWFVSHPYTKGSYKTENDYFHVGGYTMMVIGFVDGYKKEDISDDYGALSCVKDFIENGNSVLFSHDTMHFPVSANMGISGSVEHQEYQLYFQSGWDERAGAMMAIGMRDMFGMHRYDITTISSLRDSVALDAANVPKNKDGEYITETQGFTNMFLLWLNIHRNYVVNTRPNSIHTLVFNKNISEWDSQYNQILTEKVEEINEGQITMYPYDVTSTGFMKVNTTHGQYYQLDLEDDDIVVWYTLAQADDGGGNIYNDTRRDAANNYYIYSKGNITYTGAGHSDIGGVDEVRLFVNTVIRAVAAGNFVPTVTSVNGFTTRNAGTFVVNPKPYDTEYLIQFEAYDEDLATEEVIKDSYPESQWKEHIGRFAVGSIVWDDGSANGRLLKLYDRINPANYLLNKQVTDFVIYNPLDKGFTEAQINADEYLKNMYDCYMAYQQDKKVDLIISAKDYYNETGSCRIQVIEQELFDLD